MDWSTLPAQRVAYLLLLTATWGSRDAPVSAERALARAKGNVFDVVIVEPAALRSLAVRWARWANECWRRLARARRPAPYLGER
jgi:hypothetical protein